MRPPTGPYLVEQLLGITWLSVRWYGVLIVGGALLASRYARARARARGEDPEHVDGLLLLGMGLGIVGARAYYVAFEWARYAGRPPLEIISPQGGGLAIHGALLGAAVAALLYTRRHRLRLVAWLDICMPTVLIAQAIGRWGNFFNQEAYGRPTDLPWGLDIAPEYRLPPYDDLRAYPPGVRFHPTFLYESLWDLAALAAIVLAERRWRARLAPGDSALLYGALYSLGRFFTEGLRTDSLCVGPVTLDGACAGGLRVAQLVSAAAVLVCALALAWRHRRAAAAA